MDRRTQLGEFLRSRRARLRPEEFGLSDYGRIRRVPGLRREELARLAGVSVDHYVRLEQGRELHFSDEVLDAVARVLRLSGEERRHLYRLARPGTPATEPVVPVRQVVRPGLLRLLDSLVDTPAYVVGRRVELLAWNGLASALLGGFGELPEPERNFARLFFLDPDFAALFADPGAKADDIAGYLRYDAGRHPDDPALAALVGELSIRSNDFRTRWAEYDVREKTHGSYVFRHPSVGELELAYETLRLPDDPDQALITYTAEPGSPSDAALRMLATLSSARNAGVSTADRARRG